MHNRILILAIIGGLTVAKLSAQVIVKAEERSNLLSSINEILNKESLPLNIIEVKYSPFFMIEAKSTVKTEEEAKAPEAIEARLPDRVALEIISGQFKPVGSLILGNKGILQFSNGNSMRLNDTFNAKIRGEVYTIQITKITQGGYSLTLGDAVINNTFLKNSLNDTSIINRSSSSQ